MSLAADDPSLGALAAAVAVGAGAGSAARDVLVRTAQERFGRTDLGILGANLAAVALASAGSGAPPGVHVVAVVGFAGGLSTWSSLAVEVAAMLAQRRYARIMLHLPVAFCAAVALAFGVRSVLAGRWP